MKQQNDEKSYKDPVCGMEVSRLTAIAEAEYRGKTYFFLITYVSKLCPRATRMLE